MIIALTDDSEEHLILHAAILTKASIFFEGALKDAWYGDAPTFPHPTNSEIVKVYTQYLKFDNKDSIFTLGKEVSPASQVIDVAPG